MEIEKPKPIAGEDLKPGDFCYITSDHKALTVRGDGVLVAGFVVTSYKAGEAIILFKAGRIENGKFKELAE
jgi:hypothetical protein